MNRFFIFILLILFSGQLIAQTTTKTSLIGTVTFSGFSSGGTSDVTGSLINFNDQTNQYFANQIQVGDVVWDNIGQRWEVMAVSNGTLTTVDVDLRAINGQGGTPMGSGYVNRETPNVGLSVFVPDNNIGISQQLKSRVESHNMMVIDSALAAGGGGADSNGLFDAANEGDTIRVGQVHLANPDRIRIGDFSSAIWNDMWNVLNTPNRGMYLGATSYGFIFNNNAGRLSNYDFSNGYWMDHSQTNFYTSYWMTLDDVTFDFDDDVTSHYGNFYVNSSFMSYDHTRPGQTQSTSFGIASNDGQPYFQGDNIEFDAADYAMFTVNNFRIRDKSNTSESYYMPIGQPTADQVIGWDGVALTNGEPQLSFVAGGGGGGSDGQGINLASNGLSTTTSGTDTTVILGGQLNTMTNIDLNNNTLLIGDTVDLGFLIQRIRHNYNPTSFSSLVELETPGVQSIIGARVLGSGNSVDIEGRSNESNYSHSNYYNSSTVHFGPDYLGFRFRDSINAKPDLGLRFDDGYGRLWSGNVFSSPTYKIDVGENGVIINGITYPSTAPSAGQVLGEGAVDDNILEWVTISGGGSDGNGIYSASGNMFANGIATLQTPATNTFKFQTDYNGTMGINLGSGLFKNAEVEVGFYNNHGTLADILFSGTYKGTGSNIPIWETQYDDADGGDWGFLVNDAAAVIRGNSGSFILHSTNGNYFSDTRLAGSQAGIEYAADYSAGFTNRSLVDKEYVDGLALGGGTNFYTSNGSLSGNRVITGGGFNVDFDNTGTFEIDADQFQIRNSGGLITFPPSQTPSDILGARSFMFWEGSGSPGVAASDFVLEKDLAPHGQASINWTTRSGDTGANVVLQRGDAFIFNATGSGGWTEDWDLSNLQDGDIIRVKFFGATGGDAISIDPVIGTVIQASSSPGITAFIDCGDCDVEFIWSNGVLYAFD